MYKDVLRGIENIEIWPVISFTIFFLFFLFLIWWVLTVDKGFIKKMGEMPLHDGSPDQPKNSNGK